ncbi:unnamed protein product [Fraxinus pennsylvanica]|uniref:Vacuolar amino acid transporter YPQ1 n=1 Tax=Fraxinus pennsylvanica TaxID=56036 RepID=A0AAD1YZF2_9LAMI|nr:unnamed protein product [Fraxinus pennsylvanica]
MKPLLQISLSYCVKEKKPCIGWVDKYFKDCLCNLKDELSFGFGIISLVCWGVAEIPQIITNFRSKSSHGVSLLFLLTWIAGDTFNLVGCLLEPATLPTQYYTALLYTTSTVILVLQCLYYDYFYKCWRNKEKEPTQEVEEAKKPLKPPKPGATTIPIPSGTAEVTPQKDFYYYASARSLAGSTPPPIRSHLGPLRSGPPSEGIENDLSSDDEGNRSPFKKYVSQSKPIPRSVGYSAFLATSVNMPRGTQALTQVYVGLAGRKLLQEPGTENVYGQWLGWMMAAIYMCGRLPQIWLNIKRGSVQGLNPLMFIFALLANATYVASILVRSIAREKISANMPWLLDAFGCVVLDLFIILQYVYYIYFCRETCNSEEDDHGDYVEANKG